MKAAELRIGNMIGLDLKEFPENFFTVVEVAETSMKVNDGSENHFFDADTMEPIPLTEEWLLKFGFEKSKAYDFGIGTNRVPLYSKQGNDSLNWVEIILSNNVFWYTRKEYDGGSSEIYEQVVEVSHVHQLQNLYFALTGEELTIKA